MTQEQKANAKHIVKCVNMHEELVDALQANLDFALAGIGDFRECMDKSKAAIKKAEQ